MSEVFKWQDFGNDIHIGFYAEVVESKVCRRCEKEKSINHFRVKTQTRGNSVIEYPNSICKDCDKEVAAHYREVAKLKSKRAA